MSGRRLAIVSPFLDKRHGTERRVAEWIAQLAKHFEIHVYSQRVEDIDPATITWHRIPRLPGPHLFGFIFWLMANQLSREWHRRMRGLRYDLVFSPGINCFDADAMSVHIVFAEYLERVREELRVRGKGVWQWPRILQRHWYYRLIVFLERRIYTRRDKRLILIARKTQASLGRFYGRNESLPVIYGGLDHRTFNRRERLALREPSRRSLGIDENRFVLLLIGNDLRNKGLPVIVAAVSQLGALPIHVAVVTSEDCAPFRPSIRALGLEGRVHFLPPRRDVIFYYAAADAYAGPSLEDTFAQPPAEAMACGLPVIVSSQNGACEIITDERDGLILGDPTDAQLLARMIRKLCEDRVYGEELGKNAERTAQQYTWERNGQALGEIFEEILERRSRLRGPTVAQEL
jgi:glycosyltransferase involved in cell wall biosynthesis